MQKKVVSIALEPDLFVALTKGAKAMRCTKTAVMKQLIDKHLLEKYK